MVLAERIRERVEPVLRVQVVPECAGQRDVLDPVGQDREPLLRRRVISRAMSSDRAAADESRTIITRLRSIAVVIAAGHDSPGLMSLGAIQHVIPRRSRLRHAVSATCWFSVA